MSDIFREVDEALQEDKAKEIWKEWGSTIITSAVVMVVTTGMFSGIKTWQHVQKEKETTRIIQALDEQDSIPALLEIADDSKKGHQSVAIFAAAAAHLANNQLLDALTVYQGGIKNNAMLNEFEDLARIMVVRIKMSLPDEQPSAEDMMADIKPVLDDPKSAWINHAKAEAALIEAEYNGHYDKAVTVSNEILDAEVAPADLKERVKAMVHIFRQEAAKNSKSTKQEG